MKNKKAYKDIQRVSNIISPIASVLGTLNPVFLAIPVISSVANELFYYFDSKSMEKRLKSFQDAIEAQNITVEHFASKLNSLNNRGMYVVRNNLKHLCLSALPETVDALNKALIEYIMSEQQDMPEIACEIIRQFNANDILLLKKIQSYLKNGQRTAYEKKLEAAKSDIDDLLKYKENNKTAEFKHKVWHDRNVIYGTYTIMWTNFLAFNKIKINTMGNLLQDNKNPEWVHISRAMLKLQTLGVMQLDFLSTLGTVSTNNIDRFHLTLFGQKILEYIE